MNSKLNLKSAFKIISLFAIMITAPSAHAHQTVTAITFGQAKTELKNLIGHGFSGNDDCTVKARYTENKISYAYFAIGAQEPTYLTQLTYDSKYASELKYQKVLTLSELNKIQFAYYETMFRGTVIDSIKIVYLDKNRLGVSFPRPRVSDDLCSMK